MATRLDDRSAPLGEIMPWDATRAELGLVGADVPDLNIGRLATTRHVDAGRGSATAIRWFGRDDATASHPIDITYEMLDHRSSRFAGGLTRHGIETGTGVATVAGRIPELYVAAIGALKAGCVYTPIFSALRPEQIAQRLTIGGIRVLITTPVLFRRKVAKIVNRLTELELILIVGATEDSLADLLPVGAGPKPTVMSFGVFIAEGHDTFDAQATSPDTPALLHFTSGTTGAPKGALHVHDAVVVHVATAGAVLDLRPGDMYWCTADPGSVTGTSYGIIAPLVTGATAIVDEADFDAQRWYRILSSQSVNVFYTAPTAIRMLQRVGEAPGPSEFDGLRVVASFGGPLDAESVGWASQVFGVPVLDTWWQTETGAIMIANRPGDVVRPGSMGRPVPGIEVALLERTADGDLALEPNGDVRFVKDPKQSGEIALRVGWPSMFRADLHRYDEYRSCFVGLDDEWYRSGDLARRDDDGYFWFVGRGDDVIKTSVRHLETRAIPQVDDIVDAATQLLETGR